ncbi:MAG: sulfatase-like hydrolase/transferase [Planctomycetaceae bacterium]
MVVLQPLSSAPAFGAEKSTPNIVVIMADDMGYGDLSCYGATELSTPNIDRLADEGLRFTNGYCSASTCTPTRYSMLTGNYAFRTKGTGIAPPNSPAIIKPGTETVASILKRAGYATGVVGKWHLGLGGPDGPDWNNSLKPGPLEIGFDSCFLLPTTNDRVPQVYVQNHRVLNLDPKDPLWVGRKKPSPDHPTGKTHRDTLKMDWSHGHNSTIHNGISRIGFYTGGMAARFRDEDLADMWVKKSNEFIAEHKEEPFFLFFSSHDLHVPRIPHERFQGKTRLGFRGDSIVQLDWCVGELMNTLDKHDLSEDTLVVFCSDNGPVMDDGYKDFALEKLGRHKAAGPFTGGKYSVYEGGTRTPFITRWRGRIKPGVSDKIVCTIDLAASVAAITNEELPDAACVDSLNVSDALLGKDGAKGRNHLVQQDNGNNGTLALRMGDWKLHRYPRKKARNVVVEKTLANTDVPEFQLFHLPTDPAEKDNVIVENPDVAKRLKSRLDEIIEAGRTRNVAANVDELIRSRGKLVFEDSFDRLEEDDAKEQLGNGWKTNSRNRAKGVKQADLKDGYLNIKMAAVADHGVSIKHDAPFDDGVVKVRFRIHDQKGIGFNFNDPKCKVSHAGHICAFQVKPNRVMFRDGKTGIFDLNTRKKKLAGAPKKEIDKLTKGKFRYVKRKTSKSEWHEAVILIEGDTMKVWIDGKKVGALSSEGIDHNVKQNMAFAVSGTADVDDLHIWSLDKTQ